MATTDIPSLLIWLLAHTSISIAESLYTPANLNEEEVSNVLVDCITNIMETNFDHKPTVNINENIGNNSTFSVFYEQLTDYFVQHSISRFLVDDLKFPDPKYTQDTTLLCIKYIHNCESISTLTKHHIHTVIKYLVIVEFSIENCTDFEKVGKKLSIYDVTYLAKITNEDNYNIITFIPQMNATVCSIKYDLPPTLLSTCFSKKNFTAFPLKNPKDLMKCPFNIGATTLFPYVQIKNHTTLQTLDPVNANDIEGSDVELMKIIAEYLNFTSKFYYFYRKEENVFDSVNLTHLLYNGSFDIAIGGLYRIYGDAIDYSGAYNRQGVMWVYTVKRNQRSWVNLGSKLSGIYMFIIYYFNYTIIWWLFCKYDKEMVSLSNILLYSWGALIGTSSLKKATSFKKQILNISFLLLCLHLSAYISIQMYSFLTVMSPPTTYKTNKEIVESGLTPYLYRGAYNFIEDNAYQLFVSTASDCYSRAECISQMFENRGTTLLIDGIFKFIQGSTVVNDEARTFKATENLLTTYHEMVLRKNGTFNKNLQEVLIRLVEAGINDRLYNEAIGLLNIAKAERGARNIMRYSYSCGSGCSISLSQTKCVFYIWLFGCILSFVVFVIELAIRRETFLNFLL